MFSGIVTAIGTVVEVEPRRGSRRIVVAGEPVYPEIEHGESIAVDGVCLTVTEPAAGRFAADVVEETLSCTTLGGLVRGAQVNLERSLALGDRLSGHLVQGHVDTTAPILEVRRSGDDVRLRVALPEEIRHYVARKGSIALDGVSLTVAALDDEALEVALVPETLARTTLGRRELGDRLNVEVDLLARYLERMIEVGKDPGTGPDAGEPR